ncbi:general secretion pathway protein D [Burkholderiales bacterium JOSHI_001]|nr:general secretion pathway protein D [Burkholderiales bacterium JOSHI_001]
MPHPRPLPCTRPLRRAAPAVLAVLLLASAGPAPAQEQTNPRRSARAAGATPAMNSNAPVTVNFVNADIEAVSRAMAAMIERQIIVDPRVKGAITVYSEQPLSVREAYLSYLAALRGLGYALVDNAGLLKVVPEADAKLQAGTVSVGPSNQRGDQVLTQIFRLNHENPNNLVAVLRPLISPNNTINANPGNNTLVITDYADNLQRIGKIIAALDQPANTDVEVVPLQHAVAADLATLVQRLADNAAGPALVPGGAGGAGGVTILAESRSNALIVRAGSPVRLAAVKSLIEKLDRPGQGGPAGSIWVVYLKNADAAKLATVLRAAFGGGGGSGGGSSSGSGTPIGGNTGLNTSVGGANNQGGTASAAATTPVAASAQPSTGGFIQADPATNSLIITAPEPLYKQIRAMVDQLDSRRAQIYIESMIVEVSGDNAADFGFQWQGVGFLGGSEKYGLFAGTNSSVGGPSIISLTTALASTTVSSSTTLPGEGLNIGLVKKYGDVYSLAAVARMLQSQTNTNIISTPNLITLDNEEAKIIVGSNVPFITGQFTGTGGSSSTSNPFQTIERKDVGITLRIKPQVGEGGAVRMTIFQESSSVSEKVAPGTSNAGPSTDKRSIETTVTIEDGAILVLGGLIEDKFTEKKSKVPLLGDLPWVGGLFRSESRTRNRTNLMVFLRPIVMRDTDSADKLTMDRYDTIRARQQGAQPAPSVLMPINQSPVLPERPSPSNLAAPAAPASAPAR